MKKFPTIKTFIPHRQVSIIDDLSILRGELRLEDSKALSTVFAAERIKIRTDFKR